MKHVKKTLGFQHFILRMKKKCVDSCRVASHPIPLFFGYERRCQRCQRLTCNVYADLFVDPTLSLGHMY